MASVAPLIRRLAAQRGLDPRAVIAVALGEGGLMNRPGTQDIGDLAGGGSFGPFQLYTKGALPRQFRGNMKAADAWAWSPEGIAYALDQMMKVGARGLKGEAAIRKIIEDFEKPKYPSKSIAAALARLPQIKGGGGPAIPSTSGLRPAPQSNPLATDNDLINNPVLNAIIQGGDLTEALMTQPQKVAPARQPVKAIPMPDSGMPAPAGGRIIADTELFYDPLGAFKHGKAIPAIGGHTDHLHAAFSNRWDVIRAIKLAKSLGLRVGENPLVDPVERVHTPSSWHYENFDKPYMGKKVGKAIDVSGNAAALRTLFERLQPLR